MRLAAPAPREMLPWLAERAKISESPSLQAIAAINDDGEIAGMVGYDGWLPGGCQMHVALDDPRALLTLRHVAFGIPFEQIGLAFVVAPVASNNLRALDFDKRLGFREKTRFADAFGRGVDLVLLEMRREHCKWIRQRREAA